MLYEAEESIILYGFSGQSWKKIGQIVQREFQEKRERERETTQVVLLVRTEETFSKVKAALVFL